MPFQSKAQAAYLFAKHPKIAKEFAQKTKSIAALPEHKGGSKKLPVKPDLKKMK